MACCCGNDPSLRMCGGSSRLDADIQIYSVFIKSTEISAGGRRSRSSRSPPESPQEGHTRVKHRPALKTSVEYCQRPFTLFFKNNNIFSGFPPCRRPFNFFYSNQPHRLTTYGMTYPFLVCCLSPNLASTRLQGTALWGTRRLHEAAPSEQPWWARGRGRGAASPVGSCSRARRLRCSAACSVAEMRQPEERRRDQKGSFVYSRFREWGWVWGDKIPKQRRGRGGGHSRLRGCGGG